MTSMTMPELAHSEDAPHLHSPNANSNASVSPIGGEQQAAIPHTQSPVQVDTLVNSLKLSFTIGAEDTVEGKITLGKGKSILVRGKVIGDINCPGMIIIMKEGIVEGNINAGQLWIEGEIRPNDGKQSIITVGTLHIGNGALVNADCIYDQISIATPNRGVKGNLQSRPTDGG